jgi:hypothetical protein
MATWKKVIVSGSQAELATLKVDNLLNGIVTGSSNGSLGIAPVNGTGSVVLTTNAINLVHSGSFSGSFVGSGAGLSGVAASFPVTEKTNLVAADKFFIQNSVGGANEFATYGNLLTDLAGTNLVTESNDSLTLASTITGLTSVSATSFTGSFSGSHFGPLTGTASFATNATSASYAVNAGNAQSASFATNANSASYAVNAGNAVSASFATNAGAAVSAQTASSADNFTVRGTLTAQTIVAQTITSSTDFVTGSTRFGSLLANTHQFTGSVSITGSLTVNGSNVVLSNQTSSMSVLSASFATNATSASYAVNAGNAVSASYAVNAGNAVSASYALNATSASFASQAAQASTASFILGSNVNGTVSSASYALNATSASFATNANSSSYAVNAGNAQSASFALTASFAQNGGTVANALTFGTGLSGSAATFNGSAAVNVAISGSNTLSSNVVSKWTGTGLTNSNITDTGTQVQIGAGASSGVTVAAGGVNVTGNSAFNNNVTITGDLSVAGTASFINTDNLNVRDKFILLNSGSSVLADSGWVTQYNAAGSGSAFYLEAGATNNHGPYGRFAVAFDVIGTSTSLTPSEYVVTAKINQASNPSEAVPPTWGTGSNGSGNMWVTNAGDIFIYA